MLVIYVYIHQLWVVGSSIGLSLATNSKLGDINISANLDGYVSPDSVVAKLDGNIDELAVLDYYYKNIESNFSSSTSEQAGEESLGFDLSHQQNDEFNIRLKHDTQKQVTGGSLQVNADNGAKTLETTTLQASYNFEDTFTVTGEVRHQSASEIDANNVSIVNSNEDVFALNGSYKLCVDWWFKNKSTGYYFLSLMCVYQCP